jgi:hypothetical protein
MRRERAVARERENSNSILLNRKMNAKVPEAEKDIESQAVGCMQI